MTSSMLAGRVAIVTGAAQGLGAAFAEALAAAGAKVVVVDRDDPAPTCARIEAAGGTVLGRRLDVTDAAAIRAVVAELVVLWGGIDILVNNAALSAALSLTPLTEIASADWDRVMAVNARGPFEMTRAVVAPMRERGGGAIVNIASGTAVKGTPGLLHYVASKGAVIAMTRACARELGGDNIRVNCIAPGLTLTEGTLANASWTPAVMLANVESRALKRAAVPDDIVGAMMFLASPESAFVTGQTLAVDGGSVMI